MKLVAPTLLFCAQAAAFTVGPQQSRPTSTRVYADYEPMEGEGKINLKVRVCGRL